MEDQVNELILFVSTTSTACRPFLNGSYDELYTQFGDLFRMVRLDTEQLRESAMNNTRVPIKFVPSLVVATIKGAVSVYSGPQKVSAMMTSLVPPSLPPLPLVRNGHPESEETMIQIDPESSAGGTTLEFVDEPPAERAPPPPVEGLRTGYSAAGKSTMTNIKSLAKSMEQQMKSTYGYDDKNLPVPS